MTVTLSLPVLLFLCIGSTVTGFVFGVLAMLPTGRPAPLPVWPPRREIGEAGPFPVDTGPLPLWSEQEAAKAALGRWVAARISETDWLIEAGERVIGPVR